MIKFFLILTIIISTCLETQAQVLNPIELPMTYSQGKEMLIKQSLKALANHYEIDMAEAEIQQSRLWNNPTFVWNSDLYSIEKNEYFNFNNQKLIQFEYILSVSGKRIRQVKQNKIGHEIAKFAYSDVLRGLLLEFSNAYSSLYTLREKSSIYESMLNRYKSLITFYEKQLSLGIIAKNDLIRLNSEYVSTQVIASENLSQIIEKQGELNALLNLPSNTVVVPLERTIKTETTLKQEDMLSLAFDTRPDFHIAKKNIAYYEQDVKIQKSSAIPDIKLGYQPHDKGSNYVRPYSGVVVEIAVPIFNRNQGMIQKSKLKVEQSKLNLKQFTNQLENELTAAYLKYLNDKKNLERFSESFMTQIETMTKDANANFEKKNLTILQYIDYQRTYLDVKMQYLETLSSYLESVNGLNFQIGKEVFN